MKTEENEKDMHSHTFKRTWSTPPPSLKMCIECKCANMCKRPFDDSGGGSDPTETFAKSTSSHHCRPQKKRTEKKLKEMAKTMIYTMNIQWVSQFYFIINLVFAGQCVYADFFVMYLRWNTWSHNCAHFIFARSFLFLVCVCACACDWKL